MQQVPMVSIPSKQMLLCTFNSVIINMSCPCRYHGAGWRRAYLEAPETLDVSAPLKAGGYQPLIQAAFQGT